MSDRAWVDTSTLPNSTGMNRLVAVSFQGFGSVISLVAGFYALTLYENVDADFSSGKVLCLWLCSHVPRPAESEPTTKDLGLALLAPQFPDKHPLFLSHEMPFLRRFTLLPFCHALARCTVLCGDRSQIDESNVTH